MEVPNLKFDIRILRTVNWLQENLLDSDKRSSFNLNYWIAPNTSHGSGVNLFGSVFLNRFMNPDQLRHDFAEGNIFDNYQFCVLGAMPMIFNDWTWRFNHRGVAPITKNVRLDGSSFCAKKFFGLPRNFNMIDIISPSHYAHIPEADKLNSAIKKLKSLLQNDEELINEVINSGGFQQAEINREEVVFTTGDYQIEFRDQWIHRNPTRSNRTRGLQRNSLPSQSVGLRSFTIEDFAEIRHSQEQQRELIVARARDAYSRRMADLETRSNATLEALLA